MDKKNTMLLTVIAVATLLVAVVGATFAYFSVYQEDALGGTTVDATVEQVGTVTLSGGGDLDLTVTAAQMAESAAPATYSLGTANVASVKLDNEGTNETYYCKFALTVKNASTTDASVATDGGIAIDVHEGLSFDGDALESASRLNPKDIAASKTYNVKFTMGKNGTVPADGNLITVSGEIKNDATDKTQADRLANTVVDVDFEITGFECDTAAYPA